jgi:hypothetical protein
MMQLYDTCSYKDVMQQGWRAQDNLSFKSREIDSRVILSESSMNAG